MADQEGELVYLRTLRKSFFSQYLSMFSPCVRKHLHVSQLQSERNYLHAQLKKQQKGKTIFFCIFDKASKKLIGALEIRDRTITSSQLYSWLHEDYWGTGCYQEALQLAARHYFATTHYSFFSAHVDVGNKRSYYALKKQGFADTGVHSGPYGRQYCLILRKQGL